MPNLRQSYLLKSEYFELTRRDRRVLDYLEKSEASDTIEKAFQSRQLNESINETRLYSFLRENLNPQKPELLQYFDDEKSEDVVLLFIDITSFSRRIKGWSNLAIKKYLDEYYKVIIPMIYKYGGEIEKLMGDGVICLFGRPFLDLDSPKNVYRAEECAQAAIKHFHGTDKNVKVAIHKGVVTYYKVPGEHYGEYTMVGQPITDLYRLESVSTPNAINFYADSAYDHLGWRQSIFKEDEVIGKNIPIQNLQGVDYTERRYIKFPGFI